MKLQDIGRRKNSNARNRFVRTQNAYDGFAAEKSSASSEPTASDEREVVYYADGSGYLKGGGPCGDLHFDRNGNT